MAVLESSQEKKFPAMRFSQQGLTETITPPDELSLFELWNQLPPTKETLSEKEAQKKTIFYRKLVLPWLCLLAILGPAPFCIRFTRQLPVFFIYAGSIFGLVAAYLIMNAATVLGERQVLQPAWAIWTPFILFTGLCYGFFRFTVMERFCRSRG